jgi:hypothetical protein
MVKTFTFVNFYILPSGSSQEGLQVGALNQHRQGNPRKNLGRGETQKLL